ncbi:unnamed protein product, partial [Strongylus vulgaris]
HKLDRGTGYGRIGFSYPEEKLADLQSHLKEAGLPIKHELLTLATPGKAEVKAIILTDPNGHEICMVGDKGFHELCRVDPKADQSLHEAISKDDTQ